MRHNISQKLQSQQLKRKRQGSSLIIALFVLVFLSILLAGVMRSLSVANLNIAYEVIGLRALSSAQSGIQIALSRLYPTTSTSTTDCATITASPITLPNTTGFRGCSVSLNCSTRSGVINGNDLLTITSTAQCTVSDLITTRSISVEAVDL
ncbi:MSHA biogenesis protein MshP [Catenovulum agarivorans DS-2]|uniref:MSHA biogenesis protein MshP n=1 Tax=Catenovulum agarivorans DS-2 TaxID=1328313 RepID=W7Q7J8_9ALTE|nr:hypothetical protein [Catenovulum agarivorans]EWH08754.1 MSHA biogenesis protein MshP [Catenovulum agarivorans DS-2]